MTSLALADLVATSASVAATRKRRDKTEALADLLRRSTPAEAPVLVAYLAGEPPQGRIGLGWTSLAALDTRPATQPSLTVADIDAALRRVQAIVGDGSVAARHEVLDELFARATAHEQEFLRRLLLGELRQGANEGLVVDAVAKAAGVRSTLLRRALMLSGELGATAGAALTGGEEQLADIGLQVLRPLRPMLASAAPHVDEAMSTLGECSVEWKLDGARIQAHRVHDRVRIWTRNLNEVTDRLPSVVEAVRSLGATRLVLDGEVLGVTDNERPQRFQDTMSSFGAETRADPLLQPFFFDALHLDGVDMIDEPLSSRLEALATVVGPFGIPGQVTADPAVATRVLQEALAAGHEGVMVKATESAYEAGRRGKAWRKVKRVHTLDLVVLAVEWGHGRRQGWLSNLHLGARGPDGSFVMVGKTFKGLTDELLEWQTSRFLELETGRRGQVVQVRPIQVVEVAVDGVQRSTRYPGGVALRFARVRSYRHDKEAEHADTIASVQSMLA